MTSVVNLCNVSLANIGHEPFITDITENSKAAKLCSILYPVSRDTILRNNIWRCSLGVASLAPLSTEHPFGDGKYFPLPSDSLRIVGLSQDLQEQYARWRIEGNRIVAPYDELQVVYVKKLTEVSEFDASLFDVISSNLAFRLCPGLVRDSGVRQSAYDLFNQAIAKAAYVSATERDPQRILSEVFLGSRK